MKNILCRHKFQRCYQAWVVFLCLFVFNSFLDINCYAESELSLIISANSDPTRSAQVSRSHKSCISPKGMFISLIRFYQKFISTQDLPVCNFTPTCSRFAVESIQTFGLLRGILLASDRLQRCNGMSTSLYEIDPKTGKFADPVQLYKEILTK